MTKLSKAKTMLALACVLFFVLGTGTTMAVLPVIVPRWINPQPPPPDPEWDKVLGLTHDQIQKRNALLREADAALKKVKFEIDRTYRPRILAIQQRLTEQYRAILTPQQRQDMDDYSTGKKKLPEKDE
jgi:hypothetical protein